MRIDIGLLKKSIYYRKTHIENTLNLLNNKYKIDIDYNSRQQILKVFQMIDPVIALLNEDRKRMIDIKYIIKSLLEIKNINTANIPITKSKRTLIQYAAYYQNILLMASSDISKLLN